MLTLALMHYFSSWAAGQQATTSRIGLLSYSSAAAYSPRLAEHRQALADLGWVQGRNLVIEYRSAESQNDRLPELAADLLRVAFLSNPSNPGTTPTMADLKRAAPALGISVIQVEVLTPEDFERAFATIVRERADGILVAPEQLIFSQRHRIAAFAEKQRLPSAYAAVRFMDAGGLMAMAPNIADAPRLVASYVDRLLKGAKASDLPVEQPSKFELVINAKTAKAIGLTLPQSLLQRADRVIE